MANSSRGNNKKGKHFARAIEFIIKKESIIETDFLKSIFLRIKRGISFIHEKQIDTLENLIYSKTKQRYLRLEVLRRFRFLRSFKEKKKKVKTGKQSNATSKLIEKGFPIKEHDHMIEEWKRSNEERKRKLTETKMYEPGISNSESEEDPLHRK